MKMRFVMILMCPIHARVGPDILVMVSIAKVSQQGDVEAARMIPLNWEKIGRNIILIV
jgi:hypothetical protein